MTRQRLIRVLLVLAALLAAWAVVVMWTGGVLFYIGDIRISSRGPRNSVLLAVLLTGVALLLGRPGERTRAFAELASRLPAIPLIPRWGRGVAAITAIAVALAGLAEGALTVFGSDSYGYVSQAHLWSIGELRQQPALAADLGPAVSLEWLSPLGYRPSADQTTIAPTYSPGLPMVMAVFERIAGPRSVFWVVPILGAVLVWTTYLIGVRAHGPGAGMIAAVLVATSPPFLAQLTSPPMSDLPAATWWALAILLAALPGRTRRARPSGRADHVAALGAGACAALAILTRPNLAPLILIPGGLVIAELAAQRRSLPRIVQHVMLFMAGALPAFLVVGLINARLWGSFLTSGYGSLTAIFSLANVWPNLLLYPRVIAMQMPAAVLVLLAPIARLARKTDVRRHAEGHAHEHAAGSTIVRWALGLSVVAVLLAYIAYPAYDSAETLRFLLPAIPPLLVLAAVAAVSLAGGLIERHTLALVTVLVAVGGYGVDHARELGAFNREPERRSAVVGDYVARRLPERAVLLAMIHSGSATYYSGRPTLRWDFIPPERLDGLVHQLRQRGYVPYLLVDSVEKADFQAHYDGHRIGALDWPAIFTVTAPDVQIFALPDEAGSPTTPAQDAAAAQ